MMFNFFQFFIMQSKVIVSADANGNVITQSSGNPEYGFIRLQQQRVTFTDTGWVQAKNYSTLLHGRMEELESLGMEANQELPGKILVKEQTEPFNQNDPDRDLKYAGNTGIICCVDGEPIYRKTFYVASGQGQDVFVAHTNGDAIREANASRLSSTEEVQEEVEMDNSFEL